MTEPRDPQKELRRLLSIMTRLRDPDGGCPWDLEQTFATIVPHTIEEAYEVADAIARDDMDALAGELGDLLFQVVFYAQMAAETGLFDFADVAGRLSDKMVRRHPHIFAEVAATDARRQRIAWEDLKHRERIEKMATASLLDDVPTALPALSRAVKLQKRATRAGFDWPSADQVLDKIDEELAELKAETEGAQVPDQDRVEDELGDLMFAVANLARHLDLDPESALRRTNRKFERRFRFIEQSLFGEGRSVEDADLDEMERLWQQAKAGE